MRRTKSNKLSVLFAAVLFVGAGIISINYIAGVSADIERGATVSPLKATDFSLSKDFTQTSWIAFSNFGDESPAIVNGSLKIINSPGKYSSLLSQPIMLSSGSQYTVSIEYEIKNSGDDFSVKYGVVLNNLVDKPIYSSEIDKTKKSASFDFQVNAASPVSFQYFRVLGQGEFDLATIKIEEKVSQEATETVATVSPIQATPTPAISATATTTQITQAITGPSYEVAAAWSPFGSDKSVDTKSFTEKGLSVYAVAEEGWKIAKPSDKNSNFIVPKGIGVYISNEKEMPVSVNLLQTDETTKPSTFKGWNILYSATGASSSELKINVDGADRTLLDSVQNNRISKYVYIVDPSKPQDLTKLNIEKYQSIGPDKIIWVYLF